MPAAAPGIAAQDAPYTQSCTLEGTVGFNGLDKVGGTTGGKPATASRPADEMQRAADETLVEAHREDEQLLQHALVSVRSRRFICLIKSRSSCS